LVLWEGGVGVLDEARRRLAKRTSLEGASFRSTIGDWTVGAGTPHRVAIVGPNRPQATLSLDAATLLAIHAGHRPRWVLIAAWGRRVPTAFPPPAAVWGSLVAACPPKTETLSLAESPASLDPTHWAPRPLRDGETPHDPTDVAVVGSLATAREAISTGLGWGLVACCDPVEGPPPTGNLARWLGRGIAAGLRGPQGVAAAIRSQAARGVASERLADALERWLGAYPTLTRA